MRVRGSLGQVLVNDMLPEDLRDYERVLDKKGVKELLRKVADKYPDKYPEIAKKLIDFGGDAAYVEGNTISLSDLVTADAARSRMQALRNAVRKIQTDKTLSRAEKRTRTLAAASALVGKLDKEVMDEATGKGNSFSVYAASGARGSASELNQMIGAPLLMTDHRQRPVPVPIMRNYADGMSPAETWATAFGVRKGYIDVKLATPKAGYLSKQLVNAAHKLVVTKDKPMEGLGLLVDPDDADNVGAVLARKTGKYDAGTVITPRIAKDLMKEKGQILVHSAIAAPSVNGVPVWAAGIRETGDFPKHGENIGVPAVQAISNPLTQAQISSKHIGGVVGGGGKGTSIESQNAYQVVQRMANPPKEYGGYAPVVAEDGVVKAVTEAPQGGAYVQVGENRYYAPAGQEISCRPGDTVEAGDVLSAGMPNPAEVIRHKGIGEGRRYLVNSLTKLFKDNKINQNRRNVELMVRGMVNHVRITDPNGRLGYLPDDVVEYDQLAAQYKPRDGSVDAGVGNAVGQYLERPIFHYSIGSRVTPSMVKTLKQQGISNILVHREKPEFEPDMQRAVDTLSADEDWMVQMNGFNLQRNFQKAVNRGAKSTEKGLSYIPRLAKGLNFSGAQAETAAAGQERLKQAGEAAWLTR
jgi:DNA-directed RNA polymerase subunit beta'